MYRIKAAKGQGYWIPILASPEIIEDYSENVVDTLHKSASFQEANLAASIWIVR